MSVISSLKVLLLADTKQFQRGMMQASGVLRGMTQQFNSLPQVVNAGVGSLAAMGPRLAAGFGAVAAAAIGIKQAVDFEQTSLAFRVMLKDAELASRTLADLQKFADVTPFNTDEVIRSGRALLAMQVPADELISTMTAVGNVAAGLNIPFEELAALFGQFRAQSKIMTQDLRQLSTRGIPILSELAKMFGVTEQQIFEFAEEGRLGFEHVEHAFQRMTGVGGQFANLMDQQSKTVGGLFSTLSSNILVSLRDVGTGIIESLNVRGVIESLIAVVDFGRSTIVPAAVEWVSIIASGIAASVEYVRGVITSILDTMAPLFAYVTSVVRSLWDQITKLVAPAVDFFASLATGSSVVRDFAIAAGLVIAAMGAWTIATGLLSSAMGILGGILAVVLSPIGLVVVAIAGLAAWLQSTFGLFDNFGEKVTNAFLFVEYAVQNLGQVWELLYTSVAYGLVRAANTVQYWLTEVIPEYAKWFGRNFFSLIKDAASGIGTIFTNLWSNVKSFFTELWDYISSGGKDSFDFTWTPLLDGFKATTEQLPAIAERQIGEIEAMLGKDVERLGGDLMSGFEEFKKQREEEMKKQQQAGTPPPGAPPTPAAAPPSSATPPAPPPAPPAPELGPVPQLREEQKQKKDSAASKGLSALEVGTPEFIKALNEARRGGKDDIPKKQLRAAEETNQILATIEGKLGTPGEGVDLAYA